MLITAALLSMTVALQPAVAAPATADRMIALTPIPEARLEPGLAKTLLGLVTAALESGGGYQIVADRGAAGWGIELTLSGSGPWRLSARATPLGSGSRGSRFVTRKVRFTAREDMALAVDDLVSQIDALRRESDREAASTRSPVPLRQALSSSTAAVDDYIAAVTALHSADASGAADSLDRALAADPSFTLAAAQRTLVHIASGEIDRLPATFAKVRPREGAEASPLSDEILQVLPLLVTGAYDKALAAAEKLTEEAPHLVWARKLRGLALYAGQRHEESSRAWAELAKADPEDLVARAMLGRTLMATGDFASAATELERARRAWPSNMILYTLEADSLVRLRDTTGARRVLEEMRDYAVAHDLSAPSDALDPFLLVGSVDLLEGKFSAALELFEEGAGRTSKAGEPVGPIGTLLQTIVEMRRDLVLSSDSITRARQIADARTALDRYEASMSPEKRRSSEMEIQRLQGLLLIKEGDTVGTWKLVDQMRQGKAQPGFSAYDEAYLSAAASMKEDDVEGALSHFERAVEARGELVDFMDLGQTQLALRKYPEARASLEKIEKSLEKYTGGPAEGLPVSEHGNLILADPHLAAMVPIYQYIRARLAFETGNGAESRRYFNRMLKYLQRPDEQFKSMVNEAVARGAYPE